MGLPIQNTPTYTCVLPQSGQEVKYRPFLVKEQKILVLARESEDQKAVMSSLTELISNVTFGEVAVKELATIDLEFLFLQVRAKSVGETADVTISCQEEGCAGSGQATVDLNEVEVKGSVPEDNKIMLTDELGVIVRVPNVNDLQDVGDVDEGDSGLFVMKKSIETIFDAENVYEVSDVSKEDLDEFIDSLTLQQVEKVGSYFNDLPRLEKEVEYQCNLCGTKQSRTLVGLQSFF